MMMLSKKDLGATRFILRKLERTRYNLLYFIISLKVQTHKFLDNAFEEVDQIYAFIKDLTNILGRQFVF